MLVAISKNADSVGIFFIRGETNLSSDQITTIKDGEGLIRIDKANSTPPHRGKRCEPAFTKNTAEAIAYQRCVSIEELSSETEDVVENFFRLS
jgi:Tat protein secretion system quality control protein TatD with DNase activity